MSKESVHVPRLMRNSGVDAMYGGKTERSNEIMHVAYLQKHLIIETPIEKDAGDNK